MRPPIVDRDSVAIPLRRRDPDARDAYLAGKRAELAEQGAQPYMLELFDRLVAEVTAEMSRNGQR
jgi:hypothetical protein